MNHLSTEELLLLADGETAVGGAAHLESCADCRAALGELQGTLTASTTELRARVDDPTPESDDAAWRRVAAALVPQSPVPQSPHLAPRELFLYCENELDNARSAHLENCASCHDELLRAQALLAELEHELHGWVETEPAARRAAALAALEERLRPVAAKVVAFPVRWSRVYAAAAALAFTVAGGFLYNQIQTTSVSEPVAAVLPAPAPFAAEPARPAPAAIRSEAIETAARPLTAEQLPAKPLPGRFVIEALEAPPLQPQPALSASHAPALVSISDDAITAVEWTLANAAPPATMESDAGTAPIRTTAPQTLFLGDRVVGGLVRTALLEHYQDSARRSFQAPTPTALDGELARFVTGVYRSQSELLRHAYELNRLLAPTEEAAAPINDDKTRRQLLATHLRQASEHERAIYDGLAEALPRRYWAAGGKSAAKSTAGADADPAAEARALLADALALEETLTAMFNRSSVSFDISVDSSSGRLLERIQTRLRNLKSSLHTL